MKRQSTAATYTTRSTKATSFTGAVHESPLGWQAIRATPHGYVDMWAVRLSDGRAETGLRFIHQGRMYTRFIHEFYGPVWAARLGGRFAREVVDLATGAVEWMGRPQEAQSADVA